MTIGVPTLKSAAVLRNLRSLLFALSRPMTRPDLGCAVSRFGQLAIRADTGLGVHAPEQAVIGWRHGGIVLRHYELAFPAQRRAEVFAVGIEAIGVGHQHHAAPPELWPAVLRMARFTATLVSVILYLLWLSGLALATASLAAAIAVSGETLLPTSACSEPSEIHGMGATWPSTTRAVLTVLPSIWRATLACASGQSNAALWRTSQVPALRPCGGGGTTISITISPGLRSCSSSVSELGMTKNFSSGNSRTPLPGEFAE